ncbi:hypothetical protein EFN92_08775 [Lactococcus lactis]|uniref:hypothetical protein n=1 Tax=Lactococcus lactis TaxID=1358 RepID=UPI0021A5FBE6|nr:hypothetical protein [Lactococcus lactis]MCT3092732.1 hypothetical protein [Lactococcus lactis]
MADKKDELDQVNQNIATLTAKVSDLKPNLSDGDAALREVQQAYQKADQAVQETSGNSVTEQYSSPSNDNLEREAKTNSAND